MRLIGYIRVSTERQETAGNGLEAQEASIRAYAASGGHDIVGLVVEVASGGKDNRPLLAGALESLKKGNADGLIVAKLDRLARSSMMTAKILALGQKQGWKLIALDLGIDTSTPVGEMVANIMAAVAQWERRQIGARTSEALQAKKRREGGLKGSRPKVAPGILWLMQGGRRDGMSYRQIAVYLERMGVPTSQGGKWSPGTVKHILDREAGG
jgi:DNA invertase Pin-like site-specific DNA recombinase